MTTKSKDQGWPWNAIAWMAAAVIYVLTVLIARDVVASRNDEISKSLAKVEASSNTISKLNKELHGCRQQLELEQQTRNEIVSNKFDLLAHDMKATAAQIKEQAELEKKIRLLKIQQGINELMGESKADHRSATKDGSKNVPTAKVYTADRIYYNDGSTPVDAIPYWSPPAAAASNKIIRAHAEKEWPQNYAMQKYEIERQSEALVQLLARDRKADHATKQIMAKAHQQWGDNYNMMNYEVDRQLKAKSELGNR